MKPSRKLLSSVIFFTMSQHLVQAAADITIGNGPNVDIATGPTFQGSTTLQDATNNGGSSNLNVLTLTSALATNSTLVRTQTGSGSAAFGGRITVLDSVNWASSNLLHLHSSADTEIGATITNTVGARFAITAVTSVALNADVTLSGGTSNLSVTTGGDITQASSRKILVDGQADINAAFYADVTLTGENKFGTLKLSGNVVTVNEADSTELTYVGVTTLNLTSAGAVSDQSGTIIRVWELATINAGTNAITLGDVGGGITNFGSLHLTGSQVSIREDSETVLAGVSASSSLNLTSTGTITNTSGAEIAVVGAVTLNSGSNAITLGTNTGDITNFGSLRVIGGAVTITEDSSSLLTGVSAASFSLNSNGAITDSNGAILSVTGLATFNAGTNAITLGENPGDSTNFGSLSLTGGVVTVTEDSSTLLNNVSATTLNLTSSGAIQDVAGSSTVVSGLATLTGSAISLGGATSNTTFGSLNFTSAGTVSLQLDASTTITGANTGSTVSLNTTGTSTLATGSTLTGTSLTVAGGTLSLSGNNLSNSMAVGVSSGATLNLSTFDETVGTFTLNNGTLAGTATLTASSYALNGGTVNANLGTGSLNQISGTTTLNGTSAAASITVSGGNLTLGNLNRLSDTAAVTVATGTLNLGAFNETIGTLTLTNGTLAGTGTLTAATYSLNGGTVNANLGAGVLTQLSGTTTLNGASAAATVNITGGTLALGASNRLNDAAAVTATNGRLDLGAFNETVASFTLNGGTLAGTGTLTASTYALNGGTVNGNLGTGVLNQLSGTTTLNGTSAAATVNVTAGTLAIGAADRLDNAAVVTIASGGTLSLNSFTDTVGTFTLNGGTLSGTGTLTASTYDLNGGTLNGNLGAGILTQLSNTTTLNGTSAAATVNINGGTLALGNSNVLSDTATVTLNNTAILNLGSSSDTVGTFVLNNGTLNGTGMLTASTYQLNGGTLNGNLGTGVLNQLTNTTTLNGTSAAGTVNVTGGTLALGAADRLSNTAAVSVASGAIFNIGTFNDTVGAFTLNNGTLNGTGTLTAATYDLNGGILNANLGAGILTQLSGLTTLNGTSAAANVNLTGGTLALGASNRLNDSAAVIIGSGATLHTAAFDETVATLVLNGGTLAGSGALTATGGATLNSGTISGNLLGDTTSTGTVLVSGTVGGGFLDIESGVFTLNGISNSDATVQTGARFQGTGLVNGNLSNSGTLAVGSSGGILTISDQFVTTGTVALSLNNASNAEQIRAGSVDLGGALVLTNTGSGLANGEVATLIDAGSYSNGFDTFSAINFSNGVLFNNQTGMAVGLGGGSSINGGYMNLNRSQTNIYLSLFEDSVQLGVQNVTQTGSGVAFTSGISDGDPLLVAALNQATFATPGTIDLNTINSLSPEVHRGMADYAEEALRSHVREAVDAAPISRKGKTQVFATAHSTSAGVDASPNNGDYDFDLFGATGGVRYDANASFQMGGLLGVNGGNIKGSQIDTDAQGFVLGGFGRYLVKDANKTMITGSVSYGNYTYDAARESFGGEVSADDIGADAIELSVGVSTVVYEKDRLKISPGGAFRYITGNVDGFTEEGSGVALEVDSQDIDSLLLDVGVEFEYQIQEKVSLLGRLGYIHDFSDSDEPVSAAFAASGSDGLPFAVTAPGIDRQAVTLGLGSYYDLNDATRFGVNYRGEFRTDSVSSQTFGISGSYSF